MTSIDPPPGFDTDLTVRGVGPATWMVVEPLTWTGRPLDGQPAQTFTVPVGFVTDFATVPRFLQWLFRAYGPYTRAAVLHDWLLVELATWQRQIYGGKRDDEGWHEGLAPVATSRDIDGIFRAAMRDGGSAAIVRWPMWAGVRVGSLFSRKRAYGRDFLKDAPKVVGVGVLAIGNVIIPVAALAVLLALGFIKVLVFLSGGRPPARMARRRGGPGRAQTTREK